LTKQKLATSCIVDCSDLCSDDVFCIMSLLN
jgi:hypothetical protein